MSLIETEPLLKTRPERPSVIPISPEFQTEWEMYKKAEASFWTAEELKLNDDKKQWRMLDQLKGRDEAENIRELVKNIFGFFSGADGLVNENLAENFTSQIRIPEINCFYGFQIAIENIHNEVYGLLIQNAELTDEEQRKLLNAINEMENISALYDWVKKWIKRTPEDELRENPKLDPENSRDQELAVIWCFAKRLAAFVCVEGILFSGPFCAIFWLKSQGLFPGLTFANELISRDEGMHTLFGAHLYKNQIINKPPAEQVLEIVTEAVEFKQAFMDTFLGRLQGLNRTNMSQYLEYVGDRILGFLGYPKHYDTPLPLELKFMEKISFDGMTNFFEKRVGEYSLGGFEDEEEENGNLLVEDF